MSGRRVRRLRGGAGQGGGGSCQLLLRCRRHGAGAYVKLQQLPLKSFLPAAPPVGHGSIGKAADAGEGRAAGRGRRRRRRRRRATCATRDCIGGQRSDLSVMIVRPAPSRQRLCAQAAARTEQQTGGWPAVQRPHRGQTCSMPEGLAGSLTGVQVVGIGAAAEGAGRAGAGHGAGAAAPQGLGVRQVPAGPALHSILQVRWGGGGGVLRGWGLVGAAAAWAGVHGC